MSSANTSTSAVADFYRGKNVFITGGTGFLGLAVIEKMLRSLQTNRIYVLIRPKKGKTIEERLAELTKNEIFETLLAANSANVFDKLVPIAGDVGEPDLSLSAADRTLLGQQVHVIIHSAATLDFNVTLSTTVAINLLGTRRVMQLAAECSQLAAVVHVSSAFVNAWRNDAEELLYPTNTDAAHIEKMVATLSPDELIRQTPQLLGEHCNCYTMTKQFAELEVNKYAGRFPCGIVRPSMIQAAWKEPVPGWTISKNGPQAFVMGASKGVVRRLPVARNLIADYIPVDTVANQIIVTGQYVADRRDGQLAIFHATSSTCNPFRWEGMEKKINSYLQEFPLKSSVWYPHLKMMPSLLMWRISAILLHFLPALLLDTLMRLIGVRPMLWRLHTSIWNSLSLLERFVFNEWRFDNAQTLRLADAMGEADRRLFNIDVRSLKWEEYFYTLTQGVRRYLNREKPDTLPAARFKNKILLALHVLLHVGIYGLIWWSTKTIFGVGWARTGLVVPFAYRLLNVL